jgi:TPM domain
MTLTHGINFLVMTPLSTTNNNGGCEDTSTSLHQPQHTCGVNHHHHQNQTLPNSNRIMVRKSASTTSLVANRLSSRQEDEENTEDTPLLLRNSGRNIDTTTTTTTTTTTGSGGNKVLTTSHCMIVFVRIWDCLVMTLSLTPRGTPLQQAMQRSRRIRRFKSVRFWCMVLSALVILGTIGYYCFVELGGYAAIKSEAINVYKVTFEEIDHTIFNEEIQTDLSSSDLNSVRQSSLSSTIRTWMFGYSTWISQSRATATASRSKTRTSTTTTATTTSSNSRKRTQHDRNNHKSYIRHEREKRVMVDLVTRQFGENPTIAAGGKSNNTTSKSYDTIQQERSNPAVYGWTPAAYPNPRYDPLRCGISYILDEHQNHEPLHSPQTNSISLAPPTNISDSTISTPAGSASDRNSTVAAEVQPFFANVPVPNNDISIPSLNLCDPDWMLGGALLEEVADAMFNFTQIFSTHDQQYEDGDWDVAISGSHETTTNMIKRWYNTFLAKAKQLYCWIRQKVAPSAAFEQELEAQEEGEQVQNQASASVNVKRKLPPVELAVATVRKMNLLSVLRQGSFYAYEDQDDMVSDAAQIFARTLHDAWWTSDSNNNDDTAGGNNNNVDNNRHYNRGDYGILLFLSIQDRICFISTGSGVQHVLPWWRLDHIVASMKPDLRHQQYGTSIVAAIQDLTSMLLAGPPSLSDRFHDFVTRFGVVIVFAAFTFVFGAVRVFWL